MKAWLPVLVETLDETPVLALANARNLARAAVLDRRGRVLAGSLGSPVLTAQAAEAATEMNPGGSRIIDGPAPLILECLAADEKTRRFWTTANQNQSGAWASWLLTIPRRDGSEVKPTRHLLSAFGPWTPPRLPEEFQNQWSLLPLKAGLGRLFILGDDALALETAALAARTGLTVTWLSAVDQNEAELAEARLMADFDLEIMPDWRQLTPQGLQEAGLQDGVKVLITTPRHDLFMDGLRAARPSVVMFSGEAEGEVPAGLFPRPVTATQKALGLIAEMLR